MMRIKTQLFCRVFYKIITVLMILSLLLTFSGCDIHRKLKDKELDSLYQQFIELVQNQEAWSDEFMFLEGDGALYFNKDEVWYYGNDERKEQITALLGDFKSFLVSDFSNLSTKMSGYDNISVERVLFIVFADSSPVLHDNMKLKEITAHFLNNNEGGITVEANMDYEIDEQTFSADLMFHSTENNRSTKLQWHGIKTESINHADNSVSILSLKKKR